MLGARIARAVASSSVLSPRCSGALQSSSALKASDAAVAALRCSPALASRGFFQGTFNTYARVAIIGVKPQQLAKAVAAGDASALSDAVKSSLVQRSGFATSNKNRGGRPQKQAASKWDLGVRSVMPQWKEMLTDPHVKDDFLAGITVACVAVPLSLAIGIASGMTAVDGLNAAIASGVICGFLGGTPIGIAGPTAAMAPVVFNVLQTAGAPGLFFVTLVAGLLQTATGVLGVGHLIRFMPSPVIMAFTTGIAAIIAVGQMPRALGITAAKNPGIVTTLEHVASMSAHYVPHAIGIAALTILINVYLPKLTKKIPATLAAVVGAAAIASAAHFPVQFITGIPTGLPPIHMPGLPDPAQIPFILNSAVLVWAFASLESLLSGVAVDKITKPKEFHKHDPSQELIGQGLSNVGIAFLGAVPAAGVVVRSSLNASSGGKTRRSGLFQSCMVVGCVAGLGWVLEFVPIPALAGVLLLVGYRMINPADIAYLARVSPLEFGIFTATVSTIMLQDMMSGIQLGVAAEIAHLFWARHKAESPLLEGFSYRAILDPSWIYAAGGSDVKSVVLELSGNMDFTAIFKLEDMKADLKQPLFFTDETAAGLLRKGQLEIDARDIGAVDFTGLEAFVGLLEDMINMGVYVHFTDDVATQEFCRRVLTADKRGIVRRNLQLYM
eukprot:tig00000828_g4620.t1